MIKIRDVEKIISSLPPDELDQFRSWFEKFDPAYRLGREILAAEDEIKRGKVVKWSEIKHKHSL